MRESRDFRTTQMYPSDPGSSSLTYKPGLPLLGSLLSIPPRHSWLKFYDWSKHFGPIYELSIAGRPQVIISSEKIANDLLRERGNVYSSREQVPMAAQLLSDSLRPLLLPYNDLWRAGRRFMHSLTMPSAATSYQPMQEQESVRMLHDLIRSPGEYEKWLERYTAGLMLRLGFGKMLITGEEDYLKRIMSVGKNLERIASPGVYLVDTLPSLMYLPDFLAPFKREGKRLHVEELEFFRELQDDVRRETESEKLGSKHVEQENFTSKFLSSQEKWGLSDDQGAYVIGTLFEAGAGTTAAAMMSFLLAMASHPPELRSLQREIDIVVGDRMPSFEDLPGLPRVRAVVKETLRWRPVTAGGVPHQLTRDDVYELDGKKYFLKAGSAVHANQWAIHRDASLYPDAESFLPNRWLDPKYPTYKEPLEAYPNLQNFSAFGFGRRICPGLNIAERSLNILVARIAWASDIEGKQGWDYEAYEYTTGFNVQPKTFPFSLTARKGRAKIVETEYQRLWSHIIGE
jgi:cytochrome P450